MLLAEAARAETEAGAAWLDLGVCAGLDHGDAAVPGGARPHVVTLVHQQLVLYEDPPGVLQLVVFLLVAPLEVVHVEEDNLYGGGDPALLLHRPKLLRGRGDSLETLMEDAHLLLQTPEDLAAVCLVTQPAHPVLLR